MGAGDLGSEPHAYDVHDGEAVVPA
jgi:hypothetical protein